MTGHAETYGAATDSANLMSILPILLVVAGVAVAICWAIVNWRNSIKRREALLQFAAMRGWRFDLERPDLVTRWTAPPFGIGEKPHARNVISGSDQGTDLVACDYSYVTESTDSKGHRTETTHRYAVYVLSLPTFLPGLSVTSESMLSHLGDAIGLTSDVQLESEDFNRRFRVKSDHPEFASAVLNPRVMESLMSLPEVDWRIEGNSILAWKGESLLPVNFPPRLAVLHMIINGIPDFVWKDAGRSPDSEKGSSS